MTTHTALLEHLRRAAHTSAAQRGFTIVELLIVIVVIGILAAIVLNTFNGIQQRSRDTERRTDMSSLSRQLEAYYTGGGNGAYPPTYANTNAGTNSVNLRSDTDAAAKLKGIDVKALRAPGQNANTIEFATVATNITTVGTTAGTNANINKFLYQPLTATNTLCSTEGSCTKFNLYYVLEATNTIVTVTSLNQ